MSRASVKQRLIAALERERDALPAIDGERFVLEAHVRVLRGRGSGPLPYWAVSMARERGIE